MKKIISIICIITIIITSIVISTNIQAAKNNTFKATAKSNVKNITIRWKKQEGVSYYKVYRGIEEDYTSPRKKEYKEIATLSSDKTKYVDKKVKINKKYYYYVEGYTKKHDIDKRICTTFVDWNPLIATKRLDKPEIKRAGYSKKLGMCRLRVDFGYGMKPTGIEVYKKEVGKEKYKKIKVKKIKNNIVADKNTVRGKIYKYKVRTYITVNGKKYYSKKSDVVTVDRTNYVGKFDVELLNEKNKETFTLTFKVKSKNKYNANTRFLQGGGVYLYSPAQTDEETRNHIKLTQYSLDNKTWKNIPKKGVVLKATETIYLKCDLYDENAENRVSVSFGESMPYTSYMLLDDGFFGDSIKYKNSEYYTEASFDFITGDGEAHQEGD